MNDELLVIIVQRYEELYNLKHPQYSNMQRRDNIWEEIGLILKQEGTTCRERWTRIRDNYRKALNLRKTKSGQAASKIKAPKFNKELSFLIPFLNDEENRLSNISGSDMEENDSILNERDNIENLDPPTPSPSTNISYTVTTPDIQMPSRNCRKNRSSNDESAASVLAKYLSLKSRQQKTAASSTAYQSFEFNPLTHFFITMAKTVETFPIHEQVKIKSEIFNIINNTELRLATASNFDVAGTPLYDKRSPSLVLPVPQPCTSRNNIKLSEKPDSQKKTITEDVTFNSYDEWSQFEPN